ncbi:RNA pseudouridine synthase [Spirochaetia bacterium]|nr:RNA pseudouridine synthase [Spirochaetia bacterium]
MSETTEPAIVAETDDYAVVFKPPRIHCAPLRQGETGTLLDWYAAVFPPVLALAGRKVDEGGLVHRLDFETQGLVLFAKNQQSLESFQTQQEEGTFIKEYSALCLQRTSARPAGFPPPPETPGSPPFTIESFFRPFGPGRKQVRPVIDGVHKERAADRGGFYKTGIIAVSASSSPDDKTAGNFYSFTARIKRGFRHQIRCHLAWIGYPILNDPLYGPEQPAPESASGFLALCAQGLFFKDPHTGQERDYRIEGL